MELLENLKQQTKENIEKRKHLDYKAPGRYQDVADYTMKYLQRSVGGKVMPVTVQIKGKEEEVKFIASPIPDKNILLAMAFAKAEKTFDDMRQKLFGRESLQSTKIFSEQEIADATDGNVSTLNTIECLAMSAHLLKGKNKSLVKSLKKAEMQQLNDFSTILPVVLKTLKELRNYHAHIFHEPGPLRFEDLYKTNRPAGKQDQESWSAAKKWLSDKMLEAREHRIKTLAWNLEELHNKMKTTTDRHTIIKIQKETDDVQRVLDTLNRYSFEDSNGFVTKEALLFIACMFLRKGDAEYFVKKWTGLKKTDSAYRITQTLFTYFSIRDKKTLYAQNADLLKFRKIIGILSTMPEFQNDCFLPFNKFIAAHNERYGKKADEAHTKKDKEKWNIYCIPVRKNFNPIYWYLVYLQDKGHLNEFKIACYKKEADRLEAAVAIGGEKGLADFKQRMKYATGAEKRHLTQLYKSSKRNFVFSNPADADGNFCIKNDNAIIQYKFQDSRNMEWVTVQANLSCDLLLKWAFADIILGKEKQVRDKIKKTLRDQYGGLHYGEYQKKGMLLPPCIANAVDNPQLSYIPEQGKNLMLQKLEQLNDFQKRNASKKAPWQFAAKQKMDIIFEFVHLTYTQRAIHGGKSIDDRRHEALSDAEYLDALEFIRFYGKEYGTPEFKKLFFEDKGEYFRSLQGCIGKSKTLEELFHEVFVQFCKFYEKIYKQLSHDNLDKFIRLFKPNVASDRAKIEKHAEQFALNQVVLHETINIRDMAANTPEYQEWTTNVKDEKRTTDFSFIRFWLAKHTSIDTNSDFIMKVIMPELLQKKSLPLNDAGRLQGNTSLFNALMKNKTNELMMWELAKFYWGKTYGEKYKMPSYPVLQKGVDRVDQTPYKSKFFFFRLYEQELTLKLCDENGKNEKLVKIKPKKFDDEFQYYETKELYKYITTYHPRPNEKDGYLHYEQVNKEMKDVTARYLDDLYLLLRVEKEIVQKNYDYLADILMAKYQQGGWDGYYFIFGRQQPKNVNENVLSKMVYDAIHQTGEDFNLTDLIVYRNNILHQQIQPDKEKYISIKGALFNYLIKKGMIK